MADLFGVKVPAISKHLKNIFLDEELDETMVVSKMEIPTGNSAKGAPPLPQLFPKWK